jgi:hypothetical protein
MAPPPKTKPTVPTARASDGRRDRTSTVVAVTLLLLTGLGVVTIFWGPLMALASPRAEGTMEPSSAPPGAVDGGPPPTADGSSNS